MNDKTQTIVRRKRGVDEEEHHGGVWKLAFADFMTAMMAFFLVMWLINSSSKETKAAIVQYFNPTQLVDATTSDKGLRDPTRQDEGKTAQPQENVQSPPPEKLKDKEAALHSQPLETLDEIAKLDHTPPPPQNAARDPFDRAPRGAPPPPAAAAAAENAKTAAALQAEIERVAAQEARAPKVEVKQSEEGLLISLTDDANFSMFAIGSIEPKPQLVRIIGQIGKILTERRGDVELRGHTDGRSYSGRSYDNWRLSSDRATVVNYMLIRGGLPAQRIGKIVGYADRRLKIAKDPLAPANRRIEILLRGAQP
ncbi:flagellar motor protein MotB [Methylocystis parvus]|uniref:OmpA family protein n=1 Tax=Methylocystis parvus TaxID=134 RepID=A0A6B8M9C7_9HYPH|nr:flagellar motor protein MotB [Methylocystis parvus]QGM97903.1 OmpA family protein [Methylocystis parvus]WBK01784.1 OmpA family protein [Methylocystis parvus OBBP]